MLLLNRKIYRGDDQEILLLDGDRVIAAIRVTAIHQGSVSIGIEADKRFEILRGEIHRKILEETRQADGKLER